MTRLNLTRPATVGWPRQLSESCRILFSPANLVSTLSNIILEGNVAGRRRLSWSHGIPKSCQWTGLQELYSCHLKTANHEGAHGNSEAQNISFGRPRLLARCLVFTADLCAAAAGRGSESSCCKSLSSPTSVCLQPALQHLIPKDAHSGLSICHSQAVFEIAPGKLGA